MALVASAWLGVCCLGAGYLTFVDFGLGKVLSAELTLVGQLGRKYALPRLHRALGAGVGFPLV